MSRCPSLLALLVAAAGCTAEAGGPAADFTLEEADGSVVSLSSYRGRGVLLTFFGMG